MTAQDAITRETIAAAETAIRPYIRRTPILEADGADFGLDGVRLVFKLELFQHSGSFKARGAFANLVLREVPAAGVAAASGGNHGAAVAYAAQRLGVPATIFVPEISAPAKIDRIRRYGADLVIGGARYADAFDACEAHIKASGAMGVHAYDAAETMRGAGGLAKELEEDAAKTGGGPGGDLDAVLVPVGGGGMIGGVAAWFAGGPDIGPDIIAVEPARAPTLRRALDAGRPVDVDVGGVAADSLGAKRLGAHVFPIVEKRLADAVLVKDDAIVSAQKLLWEKLRVLAEPGAATAFSALLSSVYKPVAGARIGVIVCGGNTAAATVDQ